jgi:hypothetical protein
MKMADLHVRINRGARPGLHRFVDVFVGFDSVGAVRGIFGKRTRKALADLEVVIEKGRGYMYIDDRNGRLVVNADYLKRGKRVYVYLDVIHELVHIRQYEKGMELFDKRFAYVDRPTELEAYKKTVAEARRLGLSGSALIRYLEVEWVSKKDFSRLVDSLGVLH